MKNKQEQIERQQMLQALYPAVRQELMHIPGVVKVGIGVKEVAGSLTGETVFRVYVKEKIPLAALSPEQMVPPEVHGVKTDVVIIREVYDEDDTSRYRPVKGGVQINIDGSGGVGTLGCLAHLVSDNSVVILSNHHVLYDGSGADGSEVGQPTYEKSCCCTCNDIAINLHGIRRNHLDCAIAKLKPGIDHDARVKQIGFITGIANAVSGESVKKRGRTTELTTGVVTNLDLDATGTKILEVEVKKNNGNDRFSRPGDSGSALLNNQNQIIGLHKSGNNGDEVTAGNFLSTSIGIQEVLDALQSEGFQITIITGTGSDELAFEPQMQAITTPPDRAFWLLEQRLQQSEGGRQFWQIIERHQREVLHLVNHVRPVTVVWQRSQGPTFLAALARSAREPAYRIPSEIEGITREQAARRIHAAFETHGSAALRADLYAYSDLLIEAFSRFDTIDELLGEWQEMMLTVLA